MYLQKVEEGVHISISSVSALSFAFSLIFLYFSLSSPPLSVLIFPPFFPFSRKRHKMTHNGLHVIKQEVE